MKINSIFTKGNYNNKQESFSYQELIIRILLALLPCVSFLGQYIYSFKEGTQQILFHHSTVMIVDWIFIPFNFLVISTIDWKQGGKLYFIVVVSVLLNILTHAFWQYHGTDPGHMITKAGFILPAGWIHLTFSILETILILSFVFCRKLIAQKTKLVTIFATLYFIAMGISGYLIQGKATVSDVIVVISGLFLVIIYPLLHRKNPINAGDK